LGVIPLFYARVDESLLLSNSLETLRHDPRLSSSPNPLSLASHLLELWPKRSETVLENVERLPGGHLLHWCRGDPVLSQYWDPADSAEEVPSDPQSLLERFEELLAQAVDRCLASGAAGIFLSGGLDSCTVAAAAAERSRLMNRPAPWALSLVYPHASLNEEETQRKIAAGLSLRQLLVPFESAVGPDGLLGASLETASHSSAPPLNLWRPAYDTLIDEGVRRGCSVILTGEGGDEWLMPRPLYAADRLASLDLPGLFRIWRARASSAPFTASRTLRTVLWDWGARPLLRQAAGAALHAASPSATRAYRRRSILASFPPWLAPDPNLRETLVRRAVDTLADPAPRALGEQAKRALVGHARLELLLEEWFEDGRSRGIRILEPFLDPDLVAFLYGIPPEVLIRGGRTKWLARATLERRLPGLVSHWPRAVYADPFWLSLMAREGPLVWRHLGGVPALAELGLVHPGRFASAVERAFSTTSFAGATQVWAAWTLETWLRARISPRMAFSG
jgi:asparagine synthase (glutamine-hydrolysing)